MKTETLREWIEKDHGRHITVEDPTRVVPVDNLIVIHMHYDDHLVVWGMMYHILESMEDTGVGNWRDEIAITLREMRNEIRKERGEGELVA